MTNIKADIIADVYLCRTSQAGRQGPTPADELRCILIIDDKAFDVRLYFGQIGPLRPGQTAKIPINFLFPEDARKHIGSRKNILAARGEDNW
jgi:hypothetical protein